MIPWIESHMIGPFQTWGLFVAAGYAFGTYLAYRKAIQKKQDPQRVLDLAFWMFIGAFVGARAFHVLFYDFAHYLEVPLDAVDPRKPGYSMFGGLLGGAAVFTWIVKRHTLDWIAYADTIAWGLPWGCGVGRIGCFLIHDHPGTLTNFVLGVKYPDGQVRHDHGLYLSLIGFATGLWFLWLNRKNRHPGFWLGSYMIIEGISRFGLDFLRVVDVKYFGLTPTQYLAIPMFAVGIWLVMKVKKT